jgi:uncharacterized protein with HEPN domain
LTIVGEAVARLSPALKDKYPDIPWSDIKGLRNVVVHNYFGTDWSEVWNTITFDVPDLCGKVREIRDADFGDDGPACKS